MAYLLQPAFQYYAWGDKHFIQKLCGLGHLEGNPVAEMWLGAHPKAPSQVLVENQDINLNEYIKSDPQNMLGSGASLYHGQLPFLLKILAAEQPLSIQVHPDLPTAIKGFQAENAAGIDIADPKRSYKDANHKPELILALTEFSAMCGFRSYTQIISMFCSFGIQDLWPAFTAFKAEPKSLHLKDLYRQILESTADTLKSFMLRIKTTELGISHSTQHSELQFICNICQQLNSFYPLDPGIVSPLLLNTFVLQPGQAIFLEAGALHAYIKGVGVEIMANSDNVIRGGLTPKQIDRSKLFAIAKFSPQKPQVQALQQVPNQLFSFITPVQEFSMGYLSLAGSYHFQSGQKPAIALCLKGEATTAEGLFLTAGSAIFIPANQPITKLSGQAELIIASSN